eukprot:ANDGO_05776.mRNA.1 tRNA pseudouridine(27/28) synthase
MEGEDAQQVGVQLGVVADVSAPEAKRMRLDEPSAAADKYDAYEGRAKQRVALLVGYLGTNYSGLQVNPGVHTVEEELLEAIGKADLVHPLNRNSHSKNGWERCGRTDKGVHALRQIVCCKLLYYESCLEELNKHLPSDIRVFGIRRVTGSFNAKRSCSSRQYSYVCPSYLFADASVSFEDMKAGKFSLSPERIVYIQKLFHYYLGTKLSHNFTVKKSSSDASAKRHMKAIRVIPPTIIDGMECVEVLVHGNSFMLHQIRKMIGLVIAVTRGILPEEIFEFVFSPAFSFDILMAPGFCLSLDLPLFESYNKARGGQHGDVRFAELDPEVEKFRRERLLPEIVRLERSKHVCTEWLRVLEDMTTQRYKHAGDQLLHFIQLQNRKVSYEQLKQISTECRAIADRQREEKQQQKHAGNPVADVEADDGVDDASGDDDQ